MYLKIAPLYIHFIPFVLIFPVLLDILYWHSHLQKGSKGDSLNSLVRVEYGNTQLGESPKVETNTETHSTEYNFNTTFECTYGDPACLDAIAYKPVTGKYSTDFSKIHALSCRDLCCNDCSRSWCSLTGTSTVHKLLVRNYFFLTLRGYYLQHYMHLTFWSGWTEPPCAQRILWAISDYSTPLVTLHYCHKKIVLPPSINNPSGSELQGKETSAKCVFLV